MENAVNYSGFMSSAVEQSAWTASATGHHLWTVQMIVENIYVWLVGPQHPVSER